MKNNEVDAITKFGIKSGMTWKWYLIVNRCIIKAWGLK